MTNRKLSIRIPRKNQPQSALHLILLICLFGGFLTDALSIPSAVKYVVDVMNIALLTLSVMNVSRRRKRLPGDTRSLLLWIILFLIYAAVVYVVNFQSPLYFLWGTRNNFRFYAFFFACILFFGKQDVDGYLKFFDVLLYVNLVVCLIQFFVFGLRQDYLGGIFGSEKGCNAYMNNFQVIVAAKSVLFYLHRKESLKSTFTKILISLVLAAMAELKFFYVEVVLIIVGGILITRMSARKLLLLFVASVAIVGGVVVLTNIFPHFKGFLSIERIIEMASVGGYSSAKAVNRLTAIPIISDIILRTPGEQLFGLGLGNCDTSAFAFLSTPFYRRYVYLRYHWFSTAFIFLETGYIGLLFFFGFFILAALKSYRFARSNPEQAVYGQIAAVVAVMCVLIGIYNSSLRTEAAYPLYFIMAIPFILQRENAAESAANQ